MSAAGKYLREAAHESGERSFLFWCPACRGPHSFRVDVAPGDKKPQWHFDGNLESPSFEPSLLCFTTYDEDKDPPQPLPNGRRVTLCHLFLRKGQLQYCSDCPHELSGKTVPLPPWPEDC